MEAHQVICELGKQEPPGEELLSRLWKDDLKSEDSVLEQLTAICKNSKQDDLYSKLFKLLPSQRMQQPASSRKEVLFLEKGINLSLLALLSL